MNNLLKQQIKGSIGNYGSDDSKLQKLFDEVEKTYEKNQQEITDLQDTLRKFSQESNLIQQSLVQDSRDSEVILRNLKSAIAALEPNSPVLSEGNTPGNEAEYLTSSLLKLIEARKIAEEKLKAHAIELERVNKLLVIEKMQLAQAKAKDQAVLMAIGDGLMVANLLGQIVLVNKAFEMIMGWKTEEVIGRVFTEILPKESEKKEKVEDSMRLQQTVLKTGNPVSSPAEDTFYYLRKNQERFPVKITVAPIIINNQIVGTVEVFRDITIEKEIDKAKSEFVSLASHQMRTPMSSINWYTEMLLEEQLSDDQKVFVSEISYANNRITTLVDALLNVSKIEMGTFFEIKEEPINLPEFIGKLINEQRQTYEKKNIKLNQHYDTQLPTIKSDINYLGIVFQNLISNAIKYTPNDGSVSISVELDEKNTVDNIKNILFIIKDTGYGIPESQYGKIFTKLFRADNIRKIDADGNGLGLYIVKSILDFFKGKIWFESKVDQGTTFYVSIPQLAPKPIERI